MDDPPVRRLPSAKSSYQTRIGKWPLEQSVAASPVRALQYFGPDAPSPGDGPNPCPATPTKSSASPSPPRAEEIKKAYRKLAGKYHPDRNPGDKEAEANFKEVQDGLRGPLRRGQEGSSYDQFGFAGPQRRPAAGRRRFPGGGRLRLRRRRPRSTRRRPRTCSTCSAAAAAGGGVRPGRPPRRRPAAAAAAAAARRSPPPEPVETEVTVPFDVAAHGGSVGHRASAAGRST